MSVLHYDLHIPYWASDSLSMVKSVKSFLPSHQKCTKGNPLQYSCLENPMDRGAWQATVHVVPKRSQRVGHILLDQGLAYCFCKGANSKYFRFSRPDGLCLQTIQFCLCSIKAATDNT